MERQAFQLSSFAEEEMRFKGVKKCVKFLKLLVSQLELKLKALASPSLPFPLFSQLTSPLCILKLLLSPSHNPNFPFAVAVPGMEHLDHHCQQLCLFHSGRAQEKGPVRTGFIAGHYSSCQNTGADVGIHKCALCMSLLEMQPRPVLAPRNLLEDTSARLSQKPVVEPAPK